MHPKVPARRSAVFVSYSHRDVDWLHRLKVHLDPYEPELSEWDDRDLEAGDLWLAEIEKAIDGARVAVLLVSADFLASEFIKDVEIPRLLNASKKGHLRLLSLLVGPAALERSGLSAFQFLNETSRPLSSLGLRSAEAEAVLAGAAEQIASFLSDKRDGRRPRREPGLPSDTALPSRLAAATVGRLNYAMTGAFRREIATELRQSGIAESVVGKALRLRERDRPVEATFDAATSVWIISGPAGVGKSTFVDDVLRSQSDRFDLVLVLRGGRLAAASQHEADGRIAEEIARFHMELLPLSKHRRLSLAGVAHALNSRRVLIVVEDLHQAGSANETIIRLQRYLTQYHDWSERIQILATTREREDGPASAFPRGARVISLKPLPQKNAQMLFYDLCKDNQVSEEVLLANGDQLGKAFGTEAVRTPLFITICVLLASPRGHGVELRRILEMTASEIFEVFIEHLLARSGASPADYYRIRQSYYRLALDMWPEWEECRDTAIVASLAAMQQVDDAGALLEFFERGGFLFRPWYQRTRVNFPHHAMADYLAATSMTERGEYLKLTEASSRGRIEGLIQFLETTTLTNEALSRMAAGSLEAAVRVAVARSARDGGRIPVESFLDGMVKWATTPRTDGQSPETWLALRDAVAGRISDDWIATLAAAIEAKGNLQPHGIESLIRLERPASSSALRRWLAAGHATAAFEKAASAEVVTHFLAEVLRSYPAPEARAAFGLLSRHPSPDARAAMASLLHDHLLDLDADEIRTLSAAGKPALRLIGEALRDQTIAIKRSVSAKVLSSIGRALIPCGEYDVSDNGRQVSIRINRPLLVPLRNEVLQGKFAGTESFQEAIKRRVPKDKTVMSKYQALVALQHFSGVTPGPGIQFSRPEEDMPELFLDPATKQPTPYVVPDTRTTGMMRFTPPTETLVRSRIALRAVEQL